MKEKISPILVLLAVGCFLTPILGGHIPLDSVPLDTGVFSALVSGGSLPLLQHALLALPFLLALAILLIRRKVLQVPSRTLGAMFAGFFGVILATFPPSSFKGSSLPLTLEWLSYGVALYATVGAAGRRTGPRTILLSIFAGCAYTSLQGILEFGQMKARDPNWRIFGGWVNANALAAILLIGIFIGIGLAISEVGLLKLLCGLMLVPLTLALWLTQSRGALLLVLGPGLLLLTALLVIWCNKGAAKRFAPVATGLVMTVVISCCILAPIVQISLPVNQKVDAKISTGTAGAGRLSGSNLSTDQSTYFRRLLWKGTAPLFREWPAGLGMGNYRFYSAKSGLTTQTQLAHEGYLQLGVEATLLAPLLLGVALCFWTVQVCRAPSGLPREQNVLRASAIAAIFSVLAHNTVDSDFYYFGIGLITFVLIGVTLLLSADAVAPEFTPLSLRRAGISGVALLILGRFYTGGVEMIKARLRNEWMLQDRDAAVADADTLMEIAPYDADAWDLAAKTAGSPQEAATRLHTASKLGPNTRILRALARSQETGEQVGAAVSTLNTALELDPNNLVTLSQLMKLEQATNDSEATRIANRLVGVEDTLYYKIRSLPELIPTETFVARVYLASKSPSSRRKVELLMPAVRGYVEYANRTVGTLLSQPSGQEEFGGESLASASVKLQDGLNAAHELQRVAAAIDDRPDAAEAGKDAEVLAATLAKAAGSVTK